MTTEQQPQSVEVPLEPVLNHFRQLWMTDSPLEIRQHRTVIEQVRERGGRMLVHGLGLGMVAQAALLSGAEHVDVVELERDVIDLVGPHLERRWGDRLTIHHGDTTLDTLPGRWSVVWHDIWRTEAEAEAGAHDLLDRYADSCERQGAWHVTT